MKVEVKAGELIRQCRRSRNMTQKELADKIGIAASMISLYESGKNEPKFEIVLWCLKATGYELIKQEVEQ